MLHFFFPPKKLIFPGVNEEGIFRISGSLEQILKLKSRLDSGHSIDFFEENSDCHVIAGLLRLYFRELPDPLFTFEHYETFLSIAGKRNFCEISLKFQSEYSQHEQYITMLKNQVMKLPIENQRFLRYLCYFLYCFARRW